MTSHSKKPYRVVQIPSNISILLSGNTVSLSLGWPKYLSLRWRKAVTGKKDPLYICFEYTDKKILVSQKALFCFFRCNCVEPHNPSNDTLKEWRKSNISASDIIWENLTVSVSETLKNKSYLESYYYNGFYWHVEWIIATMVNCFEGILL